MVKIKFIIIRHGPRFGWGKLAVSQQTRRCGLIRSLMPRIIATDAHPLIIAAPDLETKDTARAIAQITGSSIKIDAALALGKETPSPDELIRQALALNGPVILVTHRRRIDAITEAIERVVAKPLYTIKRRRILSNQAILVGETDKGEHIAYPVFPVKEDAEDEHS